MLMEQWSPVLDLTTIIFEIKRLLEDPLGASMSKEEGVAAGITWVKQKPGIDAFFTESDVEEAGPEYSPYPASRKRPLREISGYDMTQYGSAGPLKQCHIDKEEDTALQ